MKSRTIPHSRVSTLSPGRIALGYAVIAILWIAFSDAIVTNLKLNPFVMTIKGGVFVFVTAWLLYFTTGRLVHALSRLNRELRAISDCNQVLLRCTDEQSLLEKICRLCEEAGYAMTWVAYAEHDEAKSVRPVAWAGTDEAYLTAAGISWSEDTERGRGPTGTAIRSGNTCCNQDFATDARVAPWRDILLLRGLRSALALPLKDEHGGVFGTLTIHSERRNAFTPEEIHMLEELAGDLAFGIVTLRSRAARQRAEQELALLGFALDNVREAALLSDEQGLLRYVNEHACRVLGYPRAELLRMGIPDIDPEFPAERWHDHWRELQAKKSLSFESRHRTRDGRLFPVEISANYFEYGGLAYNLALVRDITERKRAEEALRESETNLNRAQEIAHIGSWHLDVVRNRLMWSDEVFRIFGVPLGTALTYDAFLDMVHPEDRESVHKAWSAALQGAPYDIEHRIVVGLDLKWVREQAEVEFDREGDATSGIGTVQDITERKRAEEERERLRQMEVDLAHINRVSMMGELAASVSHEVNQPLAGIVSNGSAGLRFLTVDTPNLEEAVGALRDIVRDGKRAGEIIKRIRALTMRAETPREKLDLNETILDVLALVGYEAKKNSVTIRTQFADEVSPVHGDRVQLQQVLLNLVMNAIQAMSSVEDRERRLAITTQNVDGGRVQVTVEDSGTGLDPDKIAKIFEPFYTTKSGGMGMGLSICRSILQNHGGRLSATANEGPGASFHFTLPKHKGEESSAEAAAD